MRGRVMGALALSFGLTPVGALLIGELAQQIGAPWAVSLGALGSSLCVALIALRYRDLAPALRVRSSCHADKVPTSKV